MTTEATERAFLPAVAAVLRRMWKIVRADWRLLLLAGLVIFIPLGLLETIDASISEAIDEVEEPGVVDIAELIGIGALHTVGAVLGEVLFAGAVTAIVIAHHGDGRVSLRETLDGLAVGRLALADLAYVAVIFAGFLALFVPGFIFLVWFSLLGPVIEVEHLGIRAAFRRSREVVRRRPWLVAAFVLPIMMLDETITNLAHEAAISSFGETFAGEWAAGTLSELFTSLPLAVAVVVLYFMLNGDPRSSPRTSPP